MATQRPTLQRRSSSVLSIEHGDFEWLKGYFTREQSQKAITEPEMVALPVPRVGLKHFLHDEVLSNLPAMSPNVDNEPTEGFSKRRKIGWTNTEDLTILATVRRIGTQWQRIADSLHGRTADAVRNRWHRLQKTHALSDTEEGRSALDGLMIQAGLYPDWCPPELSVANDATGVQQEPQCIRGADHGRSMWTKEEDTIIEDGVRAHGCKWRQIAAMLPGRSDSSVRNRWMRLCKESQTAREAQAVLTTPPPPAAQPLITPLAPSTPTRANITACHSKPPLVKEGSEILLSELADSLKSSLDVERLPLGLGAPNVVIDLDSFVEAVTACVQDPSVCSPQRPSAALATLPSISSSVASTQTMASDLSADTDADEAMEAAASSLKRLTLASAALATFAAVSISSSLRASRMVR